ncbi:unnamed protein product, partial [Mesorhabditis spiculigera]
MCVRKKKKPKPTSKASAKPPIKKPAVVGGPVKPRVLPAPAAAPPPPATPVKPTPAPSPQPTPAVAPKPKKHPEPRSMMHVMRTQISDAPTIRAFEVKSLTNRSKFVYHPDQAEVFENCAFAPAAPKTSVAALFNAGGGPDRSGAMPPDEDTVAEVDRRLKSFIFPPLLRPLPSEVHRITPLDERTCQESKRENEARELQLATCTQGSEINIHVNIQRTNKVSQQQKPNAPVAPTMKPAKFTKADKGKGRREPTMTATTNTVASAQLAGVATKSGIVAKSGLTGRSREAHVVKSGMAKSGKKT